jgi:imidazolonepropionase-like amidohydrolase
MRTTLALAGLLALGCQPPEPASAPPSSPPPAPRATAAAPSPAPPAPAPRHATDRTTYHLHKFLQEIGTEVDSTTEAADGTVERKAAFSFRDRTTTVPLASIYVLAKDGALRHYATWGKTSRFSDVDDRVDAEGGGFRVERLGRPPAHVEPGGPFAAVSSYAPTLGQAVLLEAWLAGGKPRSMALLPEGTVTIESRGQETYDGERGAKVALEHVAISGLVWGREDAWLDEHGKLAAIVTRDAEFDHFEVARDGFASMLPAMAKSTGADGVAWLAHAADAASAPPAAGPYALVGGRLIDGTGRPPIEDSVVVIDGDRIVFAGPRAGAPIPAGAPAVDVAGRSIVPGLWDMHAHVEQVEQGAVYLAAGVTTVRDLGNILEFVTGIRDAIDAGRGLGPRVLVSGIVDGEGPGAIGTVRIAKAADVAPVMDRLAKAGCLEVKIYSSIAPALVPAIAREAHRRGLRVTGHVPFGMDAQEALDGGFDAINHITYLILEDTPYAERRTWSRAERYRRLASFDLKSPRMERLYRTLLAKKAFIDDTLVLYDLLFHTDEEDAKNEPGIAKLPRELRGMVGGVEAEWAPQAAAAFDKYVALLGELHKRGIPTVAGTDISVPGHSLHRELELYVRAGFTPMEAIQAATSVPARVMHLDGEVGTIERGKRADLIVVDGDPLADVRNLRKVVTTIARGKRYDPATLDRLVGFEP